MILDVLLCNGLGIEFGLYLSRIYFDNNPADYERDWFGKKLTVKSIFLHFRRFVIQFTPLSLNDMEWKSFSSLTRYFHIHLVILAPMLMDMNAFLLKLFLYIPTEHPINIYRLLLNLFFFSISAKQYYLFITNKKCMKMGSQCWVCVVILVLELAVSYKCAPSPFPKMPGINKWCFGVAGLAYVIFTYVMFRDLRHVKTD